MPPTLCIQGDDSRHLPSTEERRRLFRGASEGIPGTF